MVKKSLDTVIEMVSKIDGIRRIRFTSPHPKDFPENLIDVVAENDKVCKQIHLPLQSGNDRVLGKMNRTYSQLDFLKLAAEIKTRIPNVVLTTDIIVGFPTEKEHEFQDTLKVIRIVNFDSAFMFKYSERKNTIAERKYPDDVSDVDKTSRITRLVEMQRKISYNKNNRALGETFDVLVEGPSKKPDQLFGRNDSNKIVVFPNQGQNVGDFVKVKVQEVTPNTLIGKMV